MSIQFGPTKPLIYNFSSAVGYGSDRHPRMLVDVTGDGRADIVGFGDAGVYVSLNNGDGTFAAANRVVPNFGYTAGSWRVYERISPSTGEMWIEAAGGPETSCDYRSNPRMLVDLTGNGRPDILGFGNASVWVSQNLGGGKFEQTPTMAVSGFGHDTGWRVGKHHRYLAPVTGSGRPDIVGFGDAGVYVALNKGDGTFNAMTLVLTTLGYNTAGWYGLPRMLADLTGSGVCDIVGFGKDAVFVARADGKGGFGAPTQALAGLGTSAGWTEGKHLRKVVDLTGDGRADIIGFGETGVYVALNNGDGTFRPATKVLDDFGSNTGWNGGDSRKLADMTGNGLLDIVGFGEAGVWVSFNNGNGTFTKPALVLTNFGTGSAAGGYKIWWDPCFPADITGDGRCDIVGFHPTGVFGALNLG